MLHTLATWWFVRAFPPHCICSRARLLICFVSGRLSVRYCINIPPYVLSFPYGCPLAQPQPLQLKGDANPKVSRVDIEAYSSDNKRLLHTYVEVYAKRALFCETRPPTHRPYPIYKPSNSRSLHTHTRPRTPKETKAAMCGRICAVPGC